MKPFTVEKKPGLPKCLARKSVGINPFNRPATSKPNINQGADSTNSCTKLLNKVMMLSSNQTTSGVVIAEGFQYGAMGSRFIATTTGIAQTL